jgi:hypothetical protein
MVDVKAEVEKLIAKFASLQTAEERRTFLLDHPVMISLSVVRAIAEREDMALDFFKTIDVVGGRVSMVDGGISVSFNADRYPVGRGPIERLWRRIEAKEILLTLAIELAKRPEVSSILTFVYVKALCDHCHQLIGTDRARACITQRVVVEATEALVTAETLVTADEVWQMRRAAGHVWLQAAAMYLVDVADPRVLIHATAVGDRLIGECRRRNDQEYLPLLLKCMGVLYLDPYTAGRDLTMGQNYRFSLRNWQERLPDQLGAEYAQLKEGERHMTDPAVALATSDQYLRQAAKLQSGREKASTVAALLQAMMARRCLGEVVDAKEMLSLIDENLKAFKTGEDEERIIRLKVLRAGLIRSAGMEAPTEGPTPIDLMDQINWFLTAPSESIVGHLGLIATLDAVKLLTTALANQDENAVGLRIIEKFRDLFAGSGVTEQSQAGLWSSEIRLLRGWYAGKHGTIGQEAYTRPVGFGCLQFGGPATSKFRDPEADKRVAELLTLALDSGRGDKEEEGLAALDQAAQLDATLFRNNYHALTLLQMELASAAGANAFNRRDLNRATSLYISALAFSLILNQKMEVLRCLGLLEDVVTLSDYAATFRLVRALAHFASDIEVVLGSAGAKRLQSIYRQVSSLWLTRAGEPAIDMDTVFLIFRLAKGHRVSRCMRSDRRYDWTSDREALRQLEAISSTKVALGLTSRDLVARDFRDPELLLVSQSGIHELLPGGSAEEQFENLRLAFDDYLSRQAAAEGIGDLRDRWSQLDPWAPPDLVSIRDIQLAIDERTVVVDYFLGQDRDGRPMLYVFCLTSEDVILRGISVPDTSPDEAGSSEDDALAKLPPIARLVYDVRTGTNSIPGFSRVVSRNGEQALRKGMQVLFGAIADFLQASQDKGRTHLCVVPQGALHFMPFHLFGSANTALATEWTVTYLPLIDLLLESPPAPVSTDLEVTAVGLDFKQGIHPELPPLDRAPASALEVAKLLGGQALINDEATEVSVVGSLPDSRHFHLFTHGEQCVYAAAFHALYLSPDTDSGADGVLEAYELLPLDLRKVDILTLSACETALGRFDIGDNVMGLPGCLQFAGVRTILGTLWPVSAPVAERFFSRFYTEILNRKSKLKAFELAQQTARSEFPQYRDWGAFYFVGRW